MVEQVNRWLYHPAVIPILATIGGEIRKYGNDPEALLRSGV